MRLGIDRLMGFGAAWPADNGVVVVGEGPTFHLLGALSPYVDLLLVLGVLVARVGQRPDNKEFEKCLTKKRPENKAFGKDLATKGLKGKTYILTRIRQQRVRQGPYKKNCTRLRSRDKTRPQIP